MCVCVCVCVCRYVCVTMFVKCSYLFPNIICISRSDL